MRIATNGYVWLGMRIAGNVVNGLYKGGFKIHPNKALVAFDIKNIEIIQSNDLCTFDRTSIWGGVAYNDWVHPCVLYLPELWNGKKWWMGVNAYGATQGVNENPYLFYSDDEGKTWQTPAGATNPIYTLRAGFNNSSDAYIWLEGNTMWYLNRAVKEGGPQNGAVLEVITSTDGINWNMPPITILDTANGTPDLVSPSITPSEGYWYLFGTPVDQLDRLLVYRSTSILGPWVFYNTLMNSAPFNKVWHTEVRFREDRYYVLGQTEGPPGGNLVIGEFDMPSDSTIYYRNNVASVSKNDTPQNAAYYKSSLVFKENNKFQIFAGTKGPALNNSTGWRIERLQTQNLTNSLDLADYTLTESYEYNDSANGFTNGRKKIDIDRFFFKAKLNSITAAPGIYNANTNVFRLTLSLDSGVLTAGFTISGNSPAQNPEYGKVVSFGIENGDEVAFEKTSNEFSVYINKKKVFTKTKSQLPIAWGYQYLSNYIGALGFESVLSNIEVYRRQDAIYSPVRYDNEADFLMTDASMNPENYFFKDTFNRTLLGLTDDLGHTFSVIGNPAIATNDRLNVQTNNRIVYAYSGDISIYYKKNVAAGVPLIVYLLYTDSNNFLQLKFSETSTNQVIIERKISGVLNKTPIDIATSHECQRVRIDVIDNNITLYLNAVQLFTYPIPANTLQKQIQLATPYGTNTVDYIVIKKV